MTLFTEWENTCSGKGFCPKVGKGGGVVKSPYPFLAEWILLQLCGTELHGTTRSSHPLRDLPCLRTRAVTLPGPRTGCQWRRQSGQRGVNPKNQRCSNNTSKRQRQGPLALPTRMRKAPATGRQGERGQLTNRAAERRRANDSGKLPRTLGGPTRSDARVANFFEPFGFSSRSCCSTGRLMFSYPPWLGR